MTGNLNNICFRRTAPTSDEFVAASEYIEKIFSNEIRKEILMLLKQPEDYENNSLLMYCLNIAKKLYVEQETARFIPPSKQKGFLSTILLKRKEAIKWNDLDDHLKMKFRVTLSEIKKKAPGANLLRLARSPRALEELIDQSTRDFISGRWSHDLTQFMRIDMDYYTNGPQLSGKELKALATIVHRFLTPERGRRPKEAMREAVRELKKIWLSCRQDRITRISASNQKNGEFIKFIKLILGPITPPGSPLESEFSSIAMEVMCPRKDHRNTFDDFLDRIPDFNFNDTSST